MRKWHRSILQNFSSFFEPEILTKMKTFQSMNIFSFKQFFFGYAQDSAWVIWNVRFQQLLRSYVYFHRFLHRVHSIFQCFRVFLKVGSVLVFALGMYFSYCLVYGFILAIHTQLTRKI